MPNTCRHRWRPPEAPPDLSTHSTSMDIGRLQKPMYSTLTPLALYTMKVRVAESQEKRTEGGDTRWQSAMK